MSDYYAGMKRVRNNLNDALLPIGGRVTYVGHCGKVMNAIWYFGKNETGFAAAETEIGLYDRILALICRGL